MRATASCAATSTAPTTTPPTSCSTPGCSSVTLPPDGASLGQTLGEQALPKAGVSVVSVRRASSAVLQPEDGLRLAAGDTLVLSGLPEPLALAEAKLLRSG